MRVILRVITGLGPVIYASSPARKGVDGHAMLGTSLRTAMA